MANSDCSGSRWRHLAKSLIIHFLDSTKDIQEQFSLLQLSNISLYFPHCTCLQETTPCKRAKRFLHCNPFGQYSNKKKEILFEDINDNFSLLFREGCLEAKEARKRVFFAAWMQKTRKSYFCSGYSFQTVIALFWKILPSMKAQEPDQITNPLLLTVS